MKKLSLGAALVSALLVSMGANAQTPPASGNQSGTITFNGSINTDACVVTGGANSTGQNNIAVDMGSVSMYAVGTQAAPATTGTLLEATAVPVNLDIRCAAGTNVTFVLDAPNRAGEGLNSIQTTGSARNVAISLYTNGRTLIPLGGPAAGRTLATTLSAGRASLALEAFFTRLKVSTEPEDEVKAGSASGVVNYTLAYN